MKLFKNSQNYPQNYGGGGYIRKNMVYAQAGLAPLSDVAGTVLLIFQGSHRVIGS